MEERTLDGLQVAILATDGVEEIELTDPREALERAGAETMLLAPKPGTIQSMKHGDKSATYRVDMSIDNAHPDKYDAVLLPGGTLNADRLRVEKAAQDFVRAMDEARKPIAAICHAPWLLVSAGLVKVRRLTSYHTLQDDVRNAGGMWEDREVVVDGNWVTSRSPKDLPAFDREMLALFAKQREAKQRESAQERSTIA